MVIISIILSLSSTVDYVFSSILRILAILLLFPPSGIGVMLDLDLDFTLIPIDGVPQTVLMLEVSQFVVLARTPPSLSLS